MPVGVSLYLCVGLRGESGCVLSTSSASSIPLVFVQAGEIRIPSGFVRSVSSGCKSLTALFEEAAAAQSVLAASEDYARAFAHWACDKQHAIPVPYPLEETSGSGANM